MTPTAPVPTATAPKPAPGPLPPDPAATQPGALAPPAAWWHFARGLDTWTEWLKDHPQHAVPLDPTSMSGAVPTKGHP